MTKRTFKEGKIMMRRGKIQDMDRSFDLEFWQAQTAQSRFQATWELVLHATSLKGEDVRQLRFHRSVENFQRQRREVPDGQKEI